MFWFLGEEQPSCRGIWFVWAAAVSVASSSSPFDSYRSSAEIGASLTCYCTALLSAFELFAHESVDLLTRPQSRPLPNPISPLPALLDTPATQWRGFFSFLFHSLFFILLLYIFYLLCCLCLRLRVPFFSWKDAPKLPRANTVQQVFVFRPWALIYGKQ